MNEGNEFAFAWRTIKKLAVFIVIALSAAGLHLVVDAMQSYGIPASVTIPLSVVEYMILLADIVWFMRFLADECAEAADGVIRSGVVTKTLVLIGLVLLGVVIGPTLKSGFVSLGSLLF